MAYIYVKKYIIRQLTEDGLLKRPKCSEGYGYFHEEYAEYESESDALNEVIKRDYGSCVILTSVSMEWQND